MRIEGYSGPILGDAYSHPSLLENFATASGSALSPAVAVPDTIPGTGSTKPSPGSASYTQRAPGTTTSVEFTLPRVRYTAIKNSAEFAEAVAKDLAAYAEQPVAMFRNLQFSAAPNGSTVVLLTRPQGGSASSQGGSASTASVQPGSASVAPAFVGIPGITEEGFAGGSDAAADFEAVLYELQADLNTGNIRFNAVNTFLIANTAAIWQETASESRQPATAPLTFGVVSAPAGGAGGGGTGGGDDYAALRDKALKDGAGGDDEDAVAPATVINETIVIKREQKPGQPVFTGNFFVDLANEIVTDAGSVITAFARLFNFFNPPAEPRRTASAMASASQHIPQESRTAPVEPEEHVYDTSVPAIKYANKAREVLDADGKVFYKTEGDTSNDPTLTDKERRAAWRKVYPKGGR